MREEIVSRSYAAALFELGDRHGRQEAFARDIETLAGLLASDPRVRTFLATPKIDAEAKRRVLRSALADRVDPLFLNFVLVSLRKRRQRLFDSIIAEYRSLLEERLGRLHVQVTLAHEADGDTERTIGEQLSRILDRDVVPHVRVDRDILGGIIVRYHDRVMDGSWRRRLMRLRHRMLEAALPNLAGS